MRVPMMSAGLHLVAGLFFTHHFEAAHSFIPTAALRAQRYPNDDDVDIMSGTTSSGRIYKPFVVNAVVDGKSRRLVSDQEPSIDESSSTIEAGHHWQRTFQNLDVPALLSLVADHCGTRRGRDALLGMPAAVSSIVVANNPDTGKSGQPRQGRPQRSTPISPKEVLAMSPFAFSAEEVDDEYMYVREAFDALGGGEGHHRNDDGNDDRDVQVLYPPLYGAESDPFDTLNNPRTDDDEWLHFSQADQWTLENILQAEQVTTTLLNVKAWSNAAATIHRMPTIAQIGLQIDPSGNLRSISEDLRNVVKVVQLPTQVAQQGGRSFEFRLNTERFPVLRLLKDKEAVLLSQGAKEFDSQLVELQSEIDLTSQQIVSSLVYMVEGVFTDITASLNSMARLDVIFAKAAFGVAFDGVLPTSAASVTSPDQKGNGSIEVPDFVHPILLSRRNTQGGQRIYPVDLQLNDDRPLFISGPNGGGKTLILKSFGLVAIMSRLGIPIPVRPETSVRRRRLGYQRNNVDGNGNRATSDNDTPTPQVRIDYFDAVFTDIGDAQSIMEGESTWTSKLRLFSTMLQHAEHKQSNNTDHTLYLLDELGSGTDPDAGGAICRAVVEELIDLATTSRLVATTHIPSLKTLSFQSEHFNCASVKVMQVNGDTSQVSGFGLQYGIIGDSFALGAVARISPAFSESFVSRATAYYGQRVRTTGDVQWQPDVASDGAETAEATKRQSESSNYMLALAESLEIELETARETRQQQEELMRDVLNCRTAMMSMANAYDEYFEKLNTKLESMYMQLQGSEDPNAFETVGATLTQLQLARKKVRSQKDVLKEKGLRMVRFDEALAVGQSVVLFEEGGLEEMMVDVVADSLTDLSVESGMVQVTMSGMGAGEDAMMDGGRSVLTVERQNIAMWDYDDLWKDGFDNSLAMKAATMRAASITESRRNLQSAFSRLGSNELKLASKPRSHSSNGASSKSTESIGSYSSSRQRKAAKKKTKAKTKGKKK